MAKKDYDPVAIHFEQVKYLSDIVEQWKKNSTVKIPHTTEPAKKGTKKAKVIVELEKRINKFKKQVFKLKKEKKEMKQRIGELEKENKELSEHYDRFDILGLDD